MGAFVDSAMYHEAMRRSMLNENRDVFNVERCCARGDKSSLGTCLKERRHLSASIHREYYPTKDSTDVAIVIAYARDTAGDFSLRVCFRVPHAFLAPCSSVIEIEAAVVLMPDVVAEPKMDRRPRFRLVLVDEFSHCLTCCRKYQSRPRLPGENHMQSVYSKPLVDAESRALDYLLAVSTGGNSES